MRGSALVRATTAYAFLHVRACTRARLHIDEPTHTHTLSLSLEPCISGWVHARSPIVHSRRYTAGRPTNYDSINSAVILTRVSLMRAPRPLDRSRIRQDAGYRAKMGARIRREFD